MNLKNKQKKIHNIFFYIKQTEFIRKHKNITAFYHFHKFIFYIKKEKKIKKKLCLFVKKKQILDKTFLTYKNKIFNKNYM